MWEGYSSSYDIGNCRLTDPKNICQVCLGLPSVITTANLQRLVLDAPVERPVTLRVLRQGKEVSVSVTIVEAPAERPGAS